MRLQSSITHLTTKKEALNQVISWRNLLKTCLETLPSRMNTSSSNSSLTKLRGRKIYTTIKTFSTLWLLCSTQTTRWMMWPCSSIFGKKQLSRNSNRNRSRVVASNPQSRRVRQYQPSRSTQIWWTKRPMTITSIRIWWKTMRNPQR